MEMLSPSVESDGKSEQAEAKDPLSKRMLGEPVFPHTIEWSRYTFDWLMTMPEPSPSLMFPLIVTFVSLALGVLPTHNPPLLPSTMAVLDMIREPL
jgi:hypothetical protein